MVESPLIVFPECRAEQQVCFCVVSEAVYNLRPLRSLALSPPSVLWAGGRGGSLLSVRGLCQVGALKADGSVPASLPFAWLFSPPGHLLVKPCLLSCSLGEGTLLGVTPSVVGMCLCSWLDSELSVLRGVVTADSVSGG